ncbi:hypothetical protein ACLB2K_055088 [Fragaria x ananassa]
MTEAGRQRSPRRFGVKIGGIESKQPSSDLRSSKPEALAMRADLCTMAASDHSWSSSLGRTPISYPLVILIDVFSFQDKLALNITTEQGKTLKDAHGDVFRGLEVVEHACGTTTLQMGEYVSNVSNGIDTYSIREPLGVCAGICSFNFPAMIPLWMFPIAVA